MYTHGSWALPSWFEWLQLASLKVGLESCRWLSERILPSISIFPSSVTFLFRPTWDRICGVVGSLDWLAIAVVWAPRSVRGGVSGVLYG